MNPTSISVWTWNLLFVVLTLMIPAAAIVGIATSLMRAGANVGRCEVARFLGVAAERELEEPADALLYSMDAPTMRGESSWPRQRPWRLVGALEAANGTLLFRMSMRFFAAIIGELWAKLRRFFDRPFGGVTR
jgi:hypothetical protein